MIALLFSTTIPEWKNDSLFSMTYATLFLKELFESWQPTDNGILLRFIP